MSGEELERIEAELREIRRLVTQSSLKVAPAALSLTEAAQMLSCSSRHVARMVLRGELTPVDVGGLRRIPVTQIHQLLAAPPKTVPATAATKKPRYSAKAEFERWKAKR